MSSINKILNDALEKNLLTETQSAEYEKPTTDKIEIPGVSDAIVDTVKKYGGNVIKNPYVQGGAGTAAAIAAGLGALAIAKKMRKAKEEAKKKAKK